MAEDAQLKCPYCDRMRPAARTACRRCADVLFILNDTDARAAIDAILAEGEPPKPMPSPLQPSMFDMKLTVRAVGRVRIGHHTSSFDTALDLPAHILDAARLDEFHAKLKELVKEFESDEIPF